MTDGRAVDGRLLGHGARRLRRAGVESPRREARLLLAHCAGMSPDRLLLPECQPDDPVIARKFLRLLGRRARREPLSHLLGCREFMSLSFIVTPDVLDPRPDSETLVELAIGQGRARNGKEDVRILDLGTGTGCLLVSLLHLWPRARGVGVDISLPALEVARRNACNLGVGDRAVFCRSDWLSAVTGRFDLVIANPPYLRHDEMATLQPEVAREPRLALDGGKDGLDAFRRIADDIGPFLSGSAVVVTETGNGQRDPVREIFARNGLETICCRQDMAGRDRALLLARG